MQTMGSARASYRRVHTEVVAHQSSDDGSSNVDVRLTRVRKRGSPSFREWARDELRKQPVLSPKLTRIVRGGAA